MKTTLALYFGNRGFFPETLIASAREEIETALRKIAVANAAGTARNIRASTVRIGWPKMSARED